MRRPSPMNAYNAVTPIESAAVERLIKSLQSRPGGRRLNSVMWSASGSEAIQKALWACLHRDEKRDMILATRYGFHGKKGLAGAVTGCETDHDRDPRVRFISFPMAEVDDVSKYEHTFAPNAYQHRAGHPLERAGPADRLPDHRALLGGWRQLSPAVCLPQHAAKLLPASTTSCSFSTRCRRISAARARCTRSSDTASSRTSSAWERGWATASPSARPSDAAT